VCCEFLSAGCGGCGRMRVPTGVYFLLRRSHTHAHTYTHTHTHTYKCRGKRGTQGRGGGRPFWFTGLVCVCVVCVCVCVLGCENRRGGERCDNHAVRPPGFLFH
jgi:hypothetical protein